MQFRAVLVAFPGLVDLEWHGCYVGEALKPWQCFDVNENCWGHLEIMEHTAMQRISIPGLREVLKDLDWARVLLPNFRTVTIGLEDDVLLEMCRKAMETFPLWSDLRVCNA